MSSTDTTRASVPTTANDDVRHESASAKHEAEVDDSPASTQGPREPPMLVIEHQALPACSPSVPSFLDPMDSGCAGSVERTSTMEASAETWFHQSDSAQKACTDEMNRALHPCITDMDDDESMSPGAVGSMAADTSRATTLPSVTLVGKEVGDYIHTLEQLGSFDSVDWTMRDGPSPMPMPSALLRTADLPTAVGSDDAPMTDVAVTDLPSPEDVGMYQPYHSFMISLFPIEHLPPIEMASSWAFTGPANAGLPLRASPRPPHQTTFFADPSTCYLYATEECEVAKHSPYSHPASTNPFDLQHAIMDWPKQSILFEADSASTKKGPPESVRTPVSSKQVSFKEPNTDRKIGVECSAGKAAMDGSCPDRRTGRWTREEDELLREAVAKLRDRKDRIEWSAVSRTYFHGSRNATQCKSRWGKALSPTVKRGPFTAEEDAIIVDARKKGMRFSEISRLCLQGRASDHIRFRYVNALDPSRKEKKNIAWSSAEKKILYDAQKVMGNKWTTIAKLLPGRSDNDVKNFWYNHQESNRRAEKRMLADQNRAWTSPSSSFETVIEAKIPSSNPPAQEAVLEAMNPASSDSAQDAGTKPTPV